MMTDYGHEETDKQLKKLERKIHAEYEQASKEVQTKLDDYLRRFRIKDNTKREAVAVGEITQEEYTKWRTGQIMIGKRWEEMRDTLAQDLTNTDKIAMSMVREYMPEVYALNHNYGTFEAEKESMIDTSYTLYDRQTVENLIKKNPDLLPKPSVDIPKDLKWNKQKITSAITQGILQGEDIRKISKRLRNVTDMDKRAAIRNARTMTTSAENAGRSDSYTRAREMGIEMEQIWLATLDERTRDSHRKLDGEKIKVGDKWHHPKFSNGLRYPGDPEGPASEVYNCRCTLIAQVAGINLNPSDISKRNNYKLGGMSYEEWKEEHQQRAVIGFKRKDGSIKYIEGEEEAVEEKTNKAVTVNNKNEAKEELSKIFGSVENSFLKNDEELIVANTNQLLKLNNRFGAISENNKGYITGSKSGRAMGWTSSSYRKDDERTNLGLVNNYYKKPEVLIEQEKRGVADFWQMPCSEDNINIYTITHEYGHILEHYISKQREDWDAIDNLVASKINPSHAQIRKIYQDAEKKQAKTIFTEIVDIAKENNPEFKISQNTLSKYGHTNHFEAFAEIFANSQCGSPNELGLAMEEWLKREGF